MRFLTTLFKPKVQIFFQCPNFLNYYNFSDIKKRKNCYRWNPQKSGILKWKMFWKKKTTKFEKNEGKNFQLFI